MAKRRESGGAPQELQELPDKLRELCDRFSFTLPTGAAAFGERLATSADAISAKLLPGPSAGRTLIHGDAKGGNCFFETGGDGVALIDFQWSGGGLAAQDLVYLLSTSLEVVDVELLLVEYQLHLTNAGVELDLHVLRQQFKVAFLDYARFTLSDSTHKLTPEMVAENARESRCIPHKRSEERLWWLIRTASEWLEEWEAGKLIWGEEGRATP